MCQKGDTIACRLIPLLFLSSIGISLFVMSPTLVWACSNGSKIAVPMRDQNPSRIQVPMRNQSPSRIQVPMRDQDGASLVIVQFNGFGASQSATALFHGQPLDNVNRCFPAGGQPSLSGNITGSREFSVDFYSTSDCSGSRTHFFRFSVNGGSSETITCNSDTDCQSSNTVN
jgi:hypothetical protein